jgi:alpha-L-fucosidase
MTQSWGHSFSPNYKSTRQLVHTLVDVVAKGGNFLLNVAPTPEGTWEEEAYRRLAEMGDWMAVNGEGIYGTRSFQVYGEGEGLRFTQSKDGRSVYVFVLEWPGEELTTKSLRLEPGDEVAMLGYADPLQWRQDAQGLHIRLDPKMRDVSRHAWGFRVRRR